MTLFLRCCRGGHVLPQQKSRSKKQHGPDSHFKGGNARLIQISIEVICGELGMIVYKKAMYRKRAWSARPTWKTAKHGTAPMVRRFTLYQKSSWAGASFMIIYDGSTRIWKHFQLLDRRQSTDTRAHNPAHGFFFGVTSFHVLFVAIFCVFCVFQSVAARRSFFFDIPTVSRWPF